MINRVGNMCVAAMSLCMIVLIVTRKRGDGRYYFALFIRSVVVGLSQSKIISTISSFSSDNQNNHT
jgi:hypothetical protein